MQIGDGCCELRPTSALPSYCQTSVLGAAKVRFWVQATNPHPALGEMIWVHFGNTVTAHKQARHKTASDNVSITKKGLAKKESPTQAKLATGI